MKNLTLVVFEMTHIVSAMTDVVTFETTTVNPPSFSANVLLRKKEDSLLWHFVLWQCPSDSVIMFLSLSSTKELVCKRWRYTRLETNRIPSNQSPFLFSRWWTTPLWLFSQRLEMKCLLWCSELQHFITVVDLCFCNTLH